MIIGIMSMQDVNNFGSLLQAYALGKLLKDSGEVVYLPLKKNSEDEGIEVPFIDYGTKEQEGSYSKFQKIDKYFINRLRNKISVRKQNVLFQKFRETHFKKNENVILDACVIGSDEVFNCLQKSAWGWTSRLFGNVPEAKMVFTYAASCGYATFEQYGDYLQRKLCEYVPKLDSISVRDSNTKRFVQSCGVEEHKINTHLDPVLVGDFSEEITGAQKNLSIDDNLCIVYSYHNRIMDKTEISQILAFCKRKKLKLVTIGAPQVWIKDMLCLDPFEVLAVFKKAKFIITDTFHGAIMAAKYNGNFAVRIRESNANKLSDLVERIKIVNHVVSDWGELESVYNVNTDNSTVINYIEEERRNTIEYLNLLMDKASD